MSFKRLMQSYPITFAALLILLIAAGVTSFFSLPIAFVEFFCFLVLTILSFAFWRRDFKAIQNTVASINDGFVAGENTSLNHFPLPIAVFDSSDRVVWYNIRFMEDVLGENVPKQNDIKLLTGGIAMEEIRQKNKVNAKIKGKEYTVYFSQIDCAGRPSYALVFTEDTQLKTIAKEYAMAKPSVAMIAMDSADEIYRSYKENEYTQIISAIEQMTDRWFSTYTCVFRKLSGGKFIAVMPESALQEMIEKKFNIMDAVRSYTYNGAQVGITLSIGVGRGETIADAENNARQALDMALGRGGDQTALRNPDGQYDFFGGVSKGLEKRNKVRTRVVASAMEEMIKAADNILIMGHRFSDLDCIGAGMGVWQATKAFSKEAHIITDEKITMSRDLIAYLKENVGDIFIAPEDAFKYLRENTLLFLVDTHKANFSESAELCEKAPHLIVIDHHRKTVDYIKKADIFYHEPNTSSACEMVTELLEYMGKKPMIEVPCANALLAGIMLDTKEFVVRTGVRTFEAAAHLRSRGADTVTVKKFFATTLENKKLRGQILLNAENYHGCAIAFADFECQDLRIIASQAADELLSISDVDASFVLFATGTTANVSARSMGKINVQLIMEKFQGGGHQTMAAAQIPNQTIEEVKAALCQEIDRYFQNQTV